MFGNFNFFDSLFNHDFSSNFKKLRFEFDGSNPEETPMGDVKITTGENDHGTWEKKEWISQDGSTKMSSYTYTSKESKNSIDKENIKSLIKKAVNDEDYETAAKLKKELDSLDSDIN
jgi:hypothetical protein